MYIPGPLKIDMLYLNTGRKCIFTDSKVPVIPRWKYQEEIYKHT